VPAEEVRCEQCGTLVAFLIFADDATDQGRFEDYARLMFPHYSAHPGLTLTGTALTITTATIRGGTFNVDGTGTITTTVLGTGSLLVCDRDPRTPKTFTNITANAGSGIRNGNKTASWTNGIVFNCEIDQVNPHELGDLITITVA
jgi:hypothetical protein